MRAPQARQLVTLMLTAGLLGCEAVPVVGSSAAASSTPSPSSVASPSPSPTATLVVTPPPAALAFTQVAFTGFQYDAVHGDAGWAVVGLTDPGAPQPAVRFSADGETWVDANVKKVGQFDMTRVTWVNGSYYGAGTKCVAVGQVCRFDLVTWRSTDGRTWAPIGGGVKAVGVDGRLVASPNGGLVLGWLYGPGGRSVYSSTDGIAWARVDPAEFGTDVDFTGREDVIATREGFTLIGSPCDDCTARVFTSPSGEHWTPSDDLHVAGVSTVSLATDGDRIVAAISNTPLSTDIWTSAAGGPWSRAAVIPGVDGGRVAFAGSEFVLLGAAATGNGNLGAYGSRDGQSWSPLMPTFDGDGPTSSIGGGSASCEPLFLGGGDNHVVMGAEGCGAWRAALP